MTQHITTRELVEVNLNAYRNKTLGAFNRTDEQPVDCQYQYDDGKRCAIGQVLNENSMKLVLENKLNGEDLSQIHNKGIVTVESYDFADSLQSAHDRWANAELYGDSQKSRRKFIGILNEKAHLYQLQPIVE